MSRSAHAAVEIDGPKIRELRKLQGESITSLASTCGISLNYLSQIERGSRPRVSPPVYARICAALNLTSDRQRRALLKTAELASQSSPERVEYPHADYIRRLVDTAPPLNEDQRARIAMIFKSVADAVEAVRTAA